MAQKPLFKALILCLIGLVVSLSKEASANQIEPISQLPISATLAERYGDKAKVIFAAQSMLCQYQQNPMALLDQANVEQTALIINAQGLDYVISTPPYNKDACVIGAKQKYCSIMLSYTSPSSDPRLEIKIVFEKGNHTSSWISVNRDDSESWKGFRFLTEAELKPTCEIANGLSFALTKDGFQDKMIKFDGNGTIKTVTDKNNIPSTNFKPPQPKDILVGIIDDSIDYRHPGLFSKIAGTSDGEVLGYDFYDNDLFPMPPSEYYGFKNGRWNNISVPQEHGTHVAGIVAKDNNVVKIIPVRIPIESFADYIPDKYADGIRFATRSGARIINMSFVTTRHLARLEEAIKENPNVLFVVSANNGNTNIDEKPAYPASFSLKHSNVIAIANYDGLHRFSDSNWGPQTVALAAPGTNILSTIPNGKYETKTGTSMAAPYVTRVASKILAIKPSLSPEQVINILKETANHRDPDLTAAGLVNEEAALKRAQQL